MILGQTIWSNDEVARDYYTPWFSRNGDSAVFACEVLEADNVTVSITVQTKNSEMTDHVDLGNNVIEDGGHSIAVTPQPKVTEFVPSGGYWNGCLELIRFKITVTGTVSGEVGLVHLRMLNPSWITN